MFRLLAISLLVCCLSGCHPQYTILEHSDLTLPSGEHPAVLVEMVNGPITITTAKCKDITGQLTKRGVGMNKDEAESEIAAMTFESNIVDGKIIIKAKRTDGRKSWNSSGCEAVLQVPVGSTIELVTSNGNIQVNGRNKRTIAKSSNGSLTVQGVTASVDLTTTNGAVRCKDAIGQVKIATSNGSITVTGNDLLLDCKSSNGSIDCKGKLAEGNHQLITSNAHVRVQLPPDTHLNLEANTNNGKISSELKINKSDMNRRSTSYKGPLGQGDVAKSLFIKTSNSSISIRKANGKLSSSTEAEDE